MRPGIRPPPPRPLLIEVASAILVFGGLFGFSQLAAGTYVVTGSLPAKEPILGVAFVAYGVSVGLGALVRMGRSWLAALNFAGVIGILYLPAAGRPLILLLVLAHLLAVAALATNRRWFSEMASWRASPWGVEQPDDLSRGR